MSTNARTGQKTSDTAEMNSLADTLIDQLARSFTIGTDAEGCDHHYYRPADTVVVFDEDGVDHREHLDGALVAAWLNYVEEERGWLTLGQLASAGIARDRERKEGQ